MTSIPGILLQQAQTRPDELAIQDGVWTLSYHGLAELVCQSAGRMKAMGIKAGDTFAIWAPNCAEWVIAALAGQALGAVLVPLNTRYKGNEAADIIRRANCKLLFTVDGFLGLDYPAMLEGQALGDLQYIITMKSKGRASFDTFLDGDVEPFSMDHLADIPDESLSDIIFTSGTTGAPKGAMTCHGQNVDVFTAFTDAIGMKAGDRYLIVNPFFHSFGYKAGWLSCLIKGAAIYPLAVFAPAEVLRRIEEDKITVMPGAPTVFQTLLAHEDLTKRDISSLRVATTGATTIPVDLIRAMHEDLRIDHVLSAYGLTESCGVVTLCGQDDDFSTIATTCGRALPGTEIRLVDDSGLDVPLGEQGELWVRGFNVMKGYLDDVEATNETITSDGWLKTGDVAVIDEAGYIKITDRKKDMVIVGGFNCYPAEIEKTMLAHRKIKDVAVVGAADDRLGEVTHAYIVAVDDLEAEDVVKWCREHMANFKVPRKIWFKDSLPRNASGKVQKFLLVP